MSIKEVLKNAKLELVQSGVSEPQASAEVLLSDLLGLSRTELMAHNESQISPKELRKFQNYLKKRKNHEPVWQIIGKVNFWGMPYVVNKNVLVPRPETEILVKRVVEYAKSQNRALKILDLGTGSGTIVVALESELNNCSFFASDVSGAVLKVAKQNAINLVKASQIRFKKGSLFDPWKAKKFDIIATNLPYIPHEEMADLALDVYYFEPRVALDGGKEGLEIYEKFFKELPIHLNENGAVFCEIGINQGGEVQKLVQKYLPDAKVDIIGDLAGIDRVAIINR